MYVYVCGYKIQRTQECVFLKIFRNLKFTKLNVGMLSVMMFIKMGPILAF